MRFGVREIANVVFKAKTTQRIGTATFVAGQPVLYIDSATASELSGESTTVYAQGGRGNVRLISWTGEKTLTFTVTDALLSPIGFSILSGAGLIKKDGADDKAYVHLADYATVGLDDDGETKIITVGDLLTGTEEICETAPIFISTAAGGSIEGTVLSKVTISGKKFILAADDTTEVGQQVFVDFYVEKKSAAISEIQIDANDLSGNFYVEAETLFRRESDGKDLPAIITLPNVKIQSSFTFSMSPTGDPSTFDFTMDALAGYTYFNKTKKVMCVIQIIDDTAAAEKEPESVMAVTTENTVGNYYYDGYEKVDKVKRETTAKEIYNDVNLDSFEDNDATKN